MIRRAGVRLLLICGWLLALLLPAAPALAADTTIDFQQLAIGARVTDQYQSQGVLLGTHNGGFAPKVIMNTLVGPAQLPKALYLFGSMCNAEVCAPAELSASFTQCHQQISVTMEAFEETSGSVSLQAFGPSGDALGPLQSASFTRKGEPHTLTIMGSKNDQYGTISGFLLTSSSSRYLQVKTVRFDAGRECAPYFTLHRTGGPLVGTSDTLHVGSAEPDSTTFAVDRSPTWQAPITLNATPAGQGVHVRLTTPTLTGELDSPITVMAPVTVTLIATVQNPAPPADSAITVTGSSSQASIAGVGVHQLAFPVSVVRVAEPAITGMEVTQGIQNLQLPLRDATNPGAPVPYTGVSLAADSKTVVRVFADARFFPYTPAPPLRLFGYSVDASGVETPLAGGPFSPEFTPSSLSLGAEAVLAPGVVPDAQRADPAGAYVFTLPGSWTTTGGTLELKAQFMASTDPHLMNCMSLECTALQSFALTGISFAPLQQVSIRPVAITADGVFPLAPLAPNQTCVAQCNSEIPLEQPVYHEGPQGVFDPLANLTPGTDGTPYTPPFYQSSIDVSDIVDANPVTTSATANGQAVADRLLSVVGDDTLLTDHQAIVGVLPQQQGAIIRGETTPLAIDPSSIPIIPNPFDLSPIRFHQVAIVQDAGRPLSSVAHEFGHMLGRAHASKDCGGGADGQIGEDWPDTLTGATPALQSDAHGGILGVGLDRWAGSGGASGPYGSVRIGNASGLWRASSCGCPCLRSPMPPAARHTPRPTAPGIGGAGPPGRLSHSSGDGSGSGRAVRRGRCRSGLPRQRSRSRALGNSVA